MVEKDIIELDRKIAAFKTGKIDEDRFRSLRLARGVYGQRQPGVQMIRIKFPFGKATPQQLLRLAEVSDEYSTGKIHITTRQDVQIHYVSLDRTPELWAELEKDEITIREACGNVVRNITASASAGVDPMEPFDVSPYAQATFEYLLRQPFGQELGRKFKIAFASSQYDTAYTQIHDMGFIPVLKNNEKGFKVVVGGGLGAQPLLAIPIYDFLPASHVLQLIEAAVRVFDRYGERLRRNKARLKYLIADIGIDRFIELLNDEKISVKAEELQLEENQIYPETPKSTTIPRIHIHAKEEYELWLKGNVSKQKQEGYFAVGIKVQLGDISTKTLRKLVHILNIYQLNDLRFTIDQNLLIRFVPSGFLQALFINLSEIGLADPGYEALADITACPGTDTCNLGISNSTGVALELEKVIREEFSELITETALSIKISGCMNSCGQHGIANIGLHGSSLRVNKLVAPALQVLLGGGYSGSEQFDVADKIVKVPSKRAPQMLRILLSDFSDNAQEGEYYNSYYKRLGTDYFYKLLLPLTETDSLEPSDFVDWGQTEKYKTLIGVGECAGVTIDLVATLFLEADEKLNLAAETISAGQYADSIYFSYSALIHLAKAHLTSIGKKTNSHAQIIVAFNDAMEGDYRFAGKFSELVYRIKKNKPTKAFAKDYLKSALQYSQELARIQELETSQ